MLIVFAFLHAIIILDTHEDNTIHLTLGQSRRETTNQVRLDEERSIISFSQREKDNKVVYVKNIIMDNNGENKSSDDFFIRLLLLYIIFFLSDEIRFFKNKKP